MVLHIIIYQGSEVSRVTSIKVTRSRVDYFTVEGSIWAETLEVTGEDPRRGITTHPRCEDCNMQMLHPWVRTN